MSVAYCTKEDLQGRFGSDETSQLEYLSPGRVERAIADAAGIIDSYIGVRVSLPLVTIPDRLQQLACDITRYLLYSEGSAHTEARDRYEDAISFLKRYADGKATLGLPATETPTPTGGTAVRARKAVFTGSLLARMP